MQMTGNSRGRAIYEAQVSEDFRRPQTDSQLEVFIRAKYEKKKYIAREYIPTRAPEYPLGWWDYEVVALFVNLLLDAKYSFSPF